MSIFPLYHHLIYYAICTLVVYLTFCIIFVDHRTIYILSFKLFITDIFRERILWYYRNLKIAKNKWMEALHAFCFLLIKKIICENQHISMVSYSSVAVAVVAAVKFWEERGNTHNTAAVSVAYSHMSRRGVFASRPRIICFIGQSLKPFRYFVAEFRDSAYFKRCNNTLRWVSDQPHYLNAQLESNMLPTWWVITIGASVNRDECWWDLEIWQHWFYYDVVLLTERVCLQETSPWTSPTYIHSDTKTAHFLNSLFRRLWIMTWILRILIPCPYNSRLNFTIKSKVQQTIISSLAIIGIWGFNFAHFCLQSKLNCEVLYDDLAFEVRWAVAGDSVVLQLVSKLGKFRGNR